MGLSPAGCAWPPRPSPAAGDWPNWRGPNRRRRVRRDGPRRRPGRGRARTWSGAPTSPARATPIVLRRPGLRQRARRARVPPARRWWPASTPARARSSGSALPRLQHHGPLQPRGLGGARRRPGDRQRLRPERGRPARVPRPRGQDGLAAPAGRGVRPRLGLRRPHPHPARGRGPGGLRRRGRGLGRHRPAAPALHGLRQADGRRALGLDPGPGPVRRRQQPGEPHRRR